MIQDPDRSQCWLQGHYGTKAEAAAMAADIQKLAGLRGDRVGRIEVEPDPQGGWNVWLWE